VDPPDLACGRSSNGGLASVRVRSESSPSMLPVTAVFLHGPIQATSYTA
jgi:hypothetical protein